MKYFAIAIAAASLFLCAHRAASAMTEFCPARLNYAPVGNSQRSTTYGFRPLAFGPRAITGAILAFDTSGGWFAVNVPAMTLNPAKTPPVPNWMVVQQNYVSPILYVRFAAPVITGDAWVYAATARDDGTFGWQEKGVGSMRPAAIGDT